MSESTQTVHIELELEEAEKLWALADEAEGLFGRVPSEGPGRNAIDKLRAALSSSPEQGGERIFREALEKETPSAD